ncbi:hypothetical protein R1flu_008149 [Riccia fluitans]|uniref:Uncharacterized protein n=1 Tax=Riccia fluitans TaxID=41844 RepID=A0ABD1YBW5_9MARC
MDFLLWDFRICIAGVLNELREKPSSVVVKEHKRPTNWQVRGKQENWNKERSKQMLADTSGDSEGLQFRADSDKEADYQHLFAAIKMGSNGYHTDNY